MNKRKAALAACSIGVVLACIVVFQDMRALRTIFYDGEVTLVDCGPALINLDGTDRWIPRNGSIALPYGKYAFQFPQSKKTVVVFKNRKGNCTIRGKGHSLVTEEDGNVIETYVSELGK